MKPTELCGPYVDQWNNRVIAGSETVFDRVNVIFKGKNNTLIIDADNKSLTNLSVEFPAENGICVIGEIPGRLQARGSLRIGYNSLMVVGDAVTSTKPFFLCCCEQTRLLIGDDCMFSANNHVRTDDAHAIFDVESGERLNLAKDIFIGAHTWISYAAKIFGGAVVGDGSIIGANSVVKGQFFNNCTVVGSPAKCVRKNIAWERPNIARREPWIRGHASQIVKTEAYWNTTDEIRPMPRLGPSYNRIRDILTAHCPDSVWLARHDFF